MTKSFFFSLLFALSLVVSCKGSGGSGGEDVAAACAQVSGTQSECSTNTGAIVPDPETDPAIDPDVDRDTDTNTGLPNAAYMFETNINATNFSVSQMNKVLDAGEILKKLVATEAFRSAILNHTYGGKKTFVDNGGYTNAQIYQKILDAAERYKTAKNNTLDVNLILYYEDTTTVGYTYATSDKIWMNTKYFNTYTTISVARNLMHEWLHKLGFTHAATYSTSRDYSVPYAIGSIVGRLGKAL